MANDNAAGLAAKPAEEGGNRQEPEKDGEVNGRGAGQAGNKLATFWVGQDKSFLFNNKKLTIDTFSVDGSFAGGMGEIKAGAGSKIVLYASRGGLKSFDGVLVRAKDEWSPAKEVLINDSQISFVLPDLDGLLAEGGNVWLSLKGGGQQGVLSRYLHYLPRKNEEKTKKSGERVKKGKEGLGDKNKEVFKSSLTGMMVDSAGDIMSNAFFKPFLSEKQKDTEKNRQKNVKTSVSGLRGESSSTGSGQRAPGSGQRAGSPASNRQDENDEEGEEEDLEGGRPAEIPSSGAGPSQGAAGSFPAAGASSGIFSGISPAKTGVFEQEKEVLNFSPDFVAKQKFSVGQPLETSAVKTRAVPGFSQPVQKSEAVTAGVSAVIGAKQADSVNRPIPQAGGVQAGAASGGAMGSAGQSGQIKASLGVNASQEESSKNPAVGGAKEDTPENLSFEGQITQEINAKGQNPSRAAGPKDEKLGGEEAGQGGAVVSVKASESPLGGVEGVLSTDEKENAGAAVSGFQEEGFLAESAVGEGQAQTEDSEEAVKSSGGGGAKFEGGELGHSGQLRSNGEDRSQERQGGEAEDIGGQAQSLDEEGGDIQEAEGPRDGGGQAPVAGDQGGLDTEDSGPDEIDESEEGQETEELPVPAQLADSLSKLSANDQELDRKMGRRPGRPIDSLLVKKEAGADNDRKDESLKSAGRAGEPLPQPGMGGQVGTGFGPEAGQDGQSGISGQEGGIDRQEGSQFGQPREGAEGDQEGLSPQGSQVGTEMQKEQEGQADLAGDDSPDGQSDDGEEEEGRPAVPKAAGKNPIEDKKLDEIALMVNQAIDKLLNSAAAWVWGLSIPSFGLTILLGAVVGDLLVFLKKGLIERALKSAPGINTLLPAGFSHKNSDFSEKLAKKIKISSLVKLQILAMNLLVLALIMLVILLLFIFIYVGCNYPTGVVESRFSVIGSVAPEACEGVNAFVKEMGSISGESFNN